MGYTSYTANISAIKIISDKVKKANPSIKQVVGGVHATLDSDILDTLTSVDYSYTKRRRGSFSCFGRKQKSSTYTWCRIIETKVVYCLKLE